MALLDGAGRLRARPRGAGPVRPAEEPTAEPSEPIRRGSTHNPKLPVVGEALWTSDEGLALTVRIAVHAVRRIPGATVLDWSVTPLSGAGLNNGEPVPDSFNLGLTRFGERHGQHLLVRRPPRTGPSAADPIGPGLPECLCIPSRLAQSSLRVGETSLLQVAYPPLPSDLRSVDVDLATVPIFSSVPVTPIGMIPLASNPINLARSATAAIPVAGIGPFRYRPQGQRFSIGVDAVWSSSTFTSIAWTITSLEDGPGLKPQPTTVRRRSTLQPGVQPARGQRTAPRTRRPSAPPLALDQHRSERSARTGVPVHRPEGLAVGGATAVPTPQRGHQPAAHPARTSVVDLVFPGVGTVRGVPVATAPDATFRSAGPPCTNLSSGRRPGQSAIGLAGLNWPTPVPDSRELGDFRATVDEIVR
jgi:hypothetical protein